MAMQIRHWINRLSVPCAFALLLIGCRGGEGPFLQVQFCLTERAGAAELKQTLQTLARQENMRFYDRSAETEAELEALNSTIVSRSSPIINIGVRSEEGYGLGGGNSGLPANQVTLGFSPDTPEAREFAYKAVQRLQRTWEVKRVPKDQGAFALENCPS